MGLNTQAALPYERNVASQFTHHAAFRIEATSWTSAVISQTY
jgi:hypothetical protein